MLTGQALVDALIARDDRAWQAFLSEMGRLLRGICHRCELGEDDIDDVAQAVVEKLLDHDCRALRTLSIEDNIKFYGWLKIVISRTALDRVRKNRIRQDREIKWAKKRVEDPDPPKPDTDAIELRLIIENAASGLVPLDQTLLWLKYWEIPDSEMARITGLTLGAVEQRMSRLRKKIRELVPDRDGIFPD